MEMSWARQSLAGIPAACVCVDGNVVCARRCCEEGRIRPSVWKSRGQKGLRVWAQSCSTEKGQPRSDPASPKGVWAGLIDGPLDMRRIPGMGELCDPLLVGGAV